MSRRSSRGDDCAPAMFPFLAVLLCTIGALVLILVISVVHSHASAKREMDNELQDRVEQAQEQSDYLQTISQELAARREKIKQEIDRRRKELANVEDHILRLQSQLDRLRSQVESIESEDDRDQQTRLEREKKIEGLRADIDAKRKEIADEIEKAKNRKPAFSIIPYDGPNGTSRRPVYLECRAEGVVIQPEGILINQRDLRPPYGPGNPIDAALRVLRTAYQKRDATFGLTIPPYPLLVVRPDGIHIYAMARAAMSSWDDQFGYELIDAEMDLVFPPGIPQLKEELISTIDTARKRQEALVASLPRQFTRARDLDDVDFNSLSPDSFQDSKERIDSESSSHADGRDWKMIDEMPDTRILAANPNGVFGTAQAGTTAPATPGIGQPMQSIQPTPGGSFAAMRSQGQPTGSADLTQSFSGSSPPGETSGSFSPTGNGAPGAGAAGAGAAGAGAASSGASSGTSGNTSASPSGTLSPQSRANAFSSGNAMGSPSQSFRSPDSPSTNESEAMENATREQQNKEDAPRQASIDGAKKSPKANEDASKPIASSRGSGWAMPGKDPKATPVTRPIRIVALEDRWLVRKEGSETQFDAEIDLKDGPQHASSILEKTIRNRVDSWGLSLPGGYWCPSITIEPASDAQQSTMRLQRLLDGSGVEIRVAPLQAPPPKPIPPQPSRPRR